MNATNKIFETIINNILKKLFFENRDCKASFNEVEKVSPPFVFALLKLYAKNTIINPYKMSLKVKSPYSMLKTMPNRVITRITSMKNKRTLIRDNSSKYLLRLVFLINKI